MIENIESELASCVNFQNGLTVLENLNEFEKNVTKNDNKHWKIADEGNCWEALEKSIKSSEFQISTTSTWTCSNFFSWRKSWIVNHDRFSAYRPEAILPITTTVTTHRLIQLQDLNPSSRSPSLNCLKTRLLLLLSVSTTEFHSTSSRVYPRIKKLFSKWAEKLSAERCDTSSRWKVGSGRTPKAKVITSISGRKDQKTVDDVVARGAKRDCFISDTGFGLIPLFVHQSALKRLLQLHTKARARLSTLGSGIFLNVPSRVENLKLNICLRKICTHKGRECFIWRGEAGLEENNLSVEILKDHKLRNLFHFLKPSEMNFSGTSASIPFARKRKILI